MLAALVAVGSCKRESHRAVCPPGALCLLYGNGAEPATLDPAKIDGVWENVIVGQMIVGLTQFGPDGKVMPAIAKSWETSADGLTWTFHLRDANWSDGVPVTADDFVFGIRRVVDPKTASYSAFLDFPIKNAQLVNAHKLPLTALGVAAPDPHTLVIRLEHPWLLLPLYTGVRSMWPEPRHVIEKWGDAWTHPGHYVGDGPYTLAAWRLGDQVLIQRNPRFWGDAKGCFSEISFYPSPDAISTERRVRDGELDLTTTVQSNRLAYLRRTGMRDYLHVAPLGAVTYLTFNLHDPALRDVRVRQALSMAIDRDFIAKKLLRGGQTPAYGFVPPGLPIYGGGAKAYWADWSFARRQAEARRLLTAAGYGPDNPLHLMIKHRNSPDPLLFMPAVQSDWKQVGVVAELQQNDVQVAYQEYEVHDFQVGDAGWQSPDPIDYLDLSRANVGGQNYGFYNNPAYDRELDAAVYAVDPAQTALHARRAEQILLDDMPIAPIYFPASHNLVNPDVTGWMDNPGDNHGAHWLCRAPAVPNGIGATAS
ncbi:MAG TPA: peptide ABC transporter substrate-binding protein [Caulobacteraceae bacterium]|nr:peptide ABC transporter substrate-binding protein [Caulobacteraceae bacterium]